LLIACKNAEKEGKRIKWVKSVKLKKEVKAGKQEWVVQ